jgi:hypothetical protein
MTDQNNASILSFGYVYIVILGVLKEAFTYSQLGVDYFSYATIADILVSPLSYIASNLTTLLLFLAVIILVLNLPQWLAKRQHTKWFKKVFSFEEKRGSIQQQLQRTSIFVFAIGLMGFYLGTGIGYGLRLSIRLEKNELEYNDLLTFTDHQTDSVHIVGKNSSFLFYISEKKKHIEIMPMQNGMLKSIVENKQEEE